MKTETMKAIAQAINVSRHSAEVMGLFGRSEVNASIIEIDRIVVEEVAGVAAMLVYLADGSRFTLI